MEDSSVITPWEVTGEIDYDRLVERFGTTRLTPERARSCEECKRGLVKIVNKFLGAHQRRRELIKGSVRKMLE